MAKPQTKAGAAVRNKQLAAIHIARVQLGLDEDTYRDVLWTVACVHSAADLDADGRGKVLAHFRSRGFSQRRKSNPMVGKIRALWAELSDIGAVKSTSTKAINSYIKRITHVDRIEWIDKRQASLVIETLKSWIERVKAG